MVNRKGTVSDDEFEALSDCAVSREGLYEDH